MLISTLTLDLKKKLERLLDKKKVILKDIQTSIMSSQKFILLKSISTMEILSILEKWLMMLLKVEKIAKLLQNF